MSHPTIFALVPHTMTVYECSQTDFGKESDQTSVKSQSYPVMDRQMVAKGLKMSFCNDFFNVASASQS